MKKLIPLLACATLVVAAPLSAQEPKPAPAPGEIVASARAEEWLAIAPSDLLVMDLSPDAKGKPRRMVIQLMSPPFSQGWIGNIRKLAAAKWWDGTSINRVQDNYVVQWGDATEKKALPDGLVVMSGNVSLSDGTTRKSYEQMIGTLVSELGGHQIDTDIIDQLTKMRWQSRLSDEPSRPKRFSADSYADKTLHYRGWPIGFSDQDDGAWPTHCYGMVGVGRNPSPDTGTGAELYTVIGHAPRHLDRNIALVGRVIEGIEYLSSLPRGTGALGFYEKEEERVPIVSVRLGDEATDVPAFEYLSTESASFAAYADARANRRDPFFNVPAGGADICNIPVPVRRKVEN